MSMWGSPDGKNVYLAFFGSNSNSGGIAVLARDALTGALTFVEEIEEVGPVDRIAFSPGGEHVYASAVIDEQEIEWYGNGTSPSVTGVAFQPRTYPFSIWAGDTVSLSINFEYMLNLGRPVLERLARDLAEIPQVKPIVDKVVGADFRKRPGLKLHGVLDQPGVFDRVVEALDKVMPAHATP